MLDGEIGNAAARLELVRTADRLSRAHVDAALARSATIRLLLVGREGEITINLAEKKPGPGFAIQQQRVLAAPADARLCGELDLEHRRRIGEHAVAERPGLGFDPLAEFLQA